MGLLYESDKELDDNTSLTAQYKSWINNTLKKGNLSRDEIWTSDAAVGDESFVNTIRKRLGLISPISSSLCSMLYALCPMHLACS